MLVFVVTGCPMMPKHIFAGTDYRTNPKNATPIGTGPFKFAEWQRGNFIRLVRNDTYWKPGQPYLDEIIYRIVPDSQSRALALQTGQVPVSYTHLDVYKRQKKEGVGALDELPCLASLCLCVSVAAFFL